MKTSFHFPRLALTDNKNTHPEKDVIDVSRGKQARQEQDRKIEFTFFCSVHPKREKLNFVQTSFTALSTDTGARDKSLDFRPTRGVGSGTGCFYDG